MANSLGQSAATTTLVDRLRVLRRRAFTVLCFLVMVPAGAVVYSLSQKPVYSASAVVMVNRQNLASSILGTPTDPTQATEPERIITTQAQIARSPEVARLALHNATQSSGKRPSITFTQLLRSSSISGNPTADLLTFSVSNGSSERAKELANAYALAYISWRRDIDTRPYRAAGATLDKRARVLGCSSTPQAPACSTLQNSLTQLETLEAVQLGNATLTTPAYGTSTVQPLTKRNALLGLVAGLLLGMVAALVREALDTRVRSEEELAERLRIPALGELSAPARAIRRASRLVMAADAGSANAEEFRRVRTNVDFANLAVRAKAIMAVSAHEAEGKSTTVANLALAFAETGRSVAVVDLDLRRPRLHHLFGVPPQHAGFRDVVEGRVSLGEALWRCDAGLPRDTSSARGYGGSLCLLPAGPLPADAAKVLASDAVAEVLSGLRDSFDIVLIDSPPIFAVSDPMALSAQVEALLVIVHGRLARRDPISELAKAIRISTTPCLGFVKTGAARARADSYRYTGNYTVERRRDFATGRAPRDASPKA